MQNSCDEKNVVYAGFWVRFAAFLIDSLIVGILTLAARLVLAVSFSVFGLFEVNPLDVEVLFTYTVKDIILYLLGAAYYIICTYCAGTTAGNGCLISGLCLQKQRMEKSCGCLTWCTGKRSESFSAV